MGRVTPKPSHLYIYYTSCMTYKAQSSHHPAEDLPVGLERLEEVVGGLSQITSSRQVASASQQLASLLLSLLPSMFLLLFRPLLLVWLELLETSYIRMRPKFGMKKPKGKEGWTSGPLLPGRRPPIFAAGALTSSLLPKPSGVKPHRSSPA